ncbi:MAG: TonB family protein [Candidatus Solibacter sp.]|jgi:TonB family protein
MLNWTASAWPILASAALKSTFVLGVAWLMVWFLRGRTAAARHMVWTAAAAALVALPLLTVALPALRVRAANAVLPADAGLVFRTTTDTAAPGGGAVAAQPAAASRTAATPSPGRAIDGKDVLMLLWMVGIAAGFAQMLAALALLWRTRRAARVSPDQDAADALACHLGIEHPVRVLETPSGMPMTFGVLRPTVLLPEEARGWSDERRRVVLLHELGHVLRGDAVTHLVARAALALHWWNPLAWSMWRGFLKERERATDDLVLGAGTTASDYAGHLLEIARTMQARPASVAAGVAMARRSQLEGRLLAILDGSTARGQQRRAATVAAVVAAIAIMAPLAAVRAQSQAEQNPPPDVNVVFRAAAAQKNHEILDNAAVSYEQLRKFAEAQKLREASLAMVEQQSGPLSKDYAMALVKLGDLARRRHAYQESTDYYTKALALGDRPEVFSALLNLGRDAFRGDAAGGLGRLVTMLSDPAKALDYLTRARNVANNGNDLSTALTWMAIVRQAYPDGVEEADSLYRGALAAAEPDSTAQATTLDFYAQYLNNHDRAGEASVLETRAKAIHAARAAALSPVMTNSPQALRVGGGGTAPSLLYKVEPEYSEEARSAKFSGTVLLKVVVDTDGLAKDIQVIKSIGMGLDEQAVIAVTQWKFKPGTKDGAPVPVLAQIEINFKLM